MPSTNTYLAAAGAIGLYACVLALLLWQPRTQTGGRMAAQNLKLQHAREFTDVETEVDQLWNSLQDANLGALARDFLDAGLMEEHFLANLDHDPAQRSAEEIKILADLHARRIALAADARAALGGVVDSRGNSTTRS